MVSGRRGGCSTRPLGKTFGPLEAFAYSNSAAWATVHKGTRVSVKAESQERVRDVGGPGHRVKEEIVQGWKLTVPLGLSTACRRWTASHSCQRLAWSLDFHSAAAVAVTCVQTALPETLSPSVCRGSPRRLRSTEAGALQSPGKPLHEVQGQRPAHTGFIPEFRMDSTREGQCSSLY